MVHNYKGDENVFLNTAFKNRLKAHEGFSLKVYECPTGYLTVGWGRNLETKGINAHEANMLLETDLEDCEGSVLNLLAPLGLTFDLDPIRFGVLVEMVFQLGETNVRKFERMFAALKEHDYEKAAEEMLDSQWHKQTPARCETLAEIMRSGEGEAYIF